jgi:peptidoglycan/xylan/chitin deacetylase (PgdA/CDA1 family)
LKLSIFIIYPSIFILSTFFQCILKSELPPEKPRQIEIGDHRKKEVVVFVYHRFGNSKYPSTNISIKDFQSHLAYLKNNKFKVLTFGEAIDYINNPKIEYFEKIACLTVDDGYLTFKSNAMPLLKKFGFSATLFINSESVGGGSYLDWNELREVHEQGIEIGNHSHSHAYFLNLPINERIDVFKKDIKQCQEEVNSHLGFYPEVFAYPYGEFDPDMKELVKELKFKGAAAQNSGVMYFHDNYSIPRFPMAGPYVKIEGFAEKANMKALRVQSKNPESFLLAGTNPPKINIAFDTSMVDLSRHNCFTSGECETSIQGKFMTIQAKTKLTKRRTLYTITAPSKNGKGWYWHSHLWIQPEVTE